METVRTAARWFYGLGLIVNEKRHLGHSSKPWDTSVDMTLWKFCRPIWKAQKQTLDMFKWCNHTCDRINVIPETIFIRLRSFPAPMNRGGHLDFCKDWDTGIITCTRDDISICVLILSDWSRSVYRNCQRLRYYSIHSIIQCILLCRVFIYTEMTFTSTLYWDFFHCFYIAFIRCRCSSFFVFKLSTFSSSPEQQG